MGPTASGKTALALKMASMYPIEIISVDSALIYNDMNIGTAKPSVVELASVPHHLINIISPLEVYSVADFVKDSVKIANDIISRGKTPVFVGGTMMYYNALINGLSELPATSSEIRIQIENSIAKTGIEDAYSRLHEIDPVSAAKIKSKDTQRITRALEVYEVTGMPMSTLQDQLKPQIKHDFSFLGFRIIPFDRTILHERINQRFIQMLENGLIDEVRALRAKYPELTITHTSMRSVGYKQVWQYLENEINDLELIEIGQAATRQLAKRQLTWLRNMNFTNLDQLVEITDVENIEKNIELVKMFM